MDNFLLKHQQEVDKITLLTEFISKNPQPRELKRALAVKMALGNQPYSRITDLQHFAQLVRTIAAMSKVVF